jgi:hypothetical protein
VSHRILAAVTALAVVFWVVLLAPGLAAGQAFWPRDTPKLPMAKTWVAQKATLPPYSPPRTPDGVPDLQGVWGGAGGDGTSFLEDHEYVDVTTPAQESFVSDPPDGKVPYTPWALAKRKEILAGLGHGWPGESGERLYSSPSAFCLNFMPRAGGFEGQEIVQKPGSVIMLTGIGYRVIPTDGRPHISQNVKSWFGNSRGRWEGDTLVVETTNFNGLNPLRGSGEQMRVTERFTRVDADTIRYQFTVDDPSTWTKPWSAELPLQRTIGPLFEHACHEGNRGLYNSLVGARLEEKRAAEEAAKKAGH